MTTTMHQPESDEILYRFFGGFAASHRSVSLCQHLRAELDAHLAWTIQMGETINLTKDEAAAVGAEGVMPIDLTEDEKHLFGEHATKLFFWGRGSRKCGVCGHIARGKLAQSTVEEKSRWQRRADEGNAASDAAIDAAVKVVTRPKPVR
jgi:hypothetical protein